jgi:hypothetical protein
MGGGNFAEPRSDASRRGRVVVAGGKTISPAPMALARNVTKHPLDRIQFLIAIQIYAKCTLVWIAVINRDSNICKILPILDRDY